MKIRSITYFIDPQKPNYTHELENAYHHQQALRKKLEALEIEVQSTRLATPPLMQWFNPQQDPSYKQIQELAARCQDFHFDYISLGPCECMQQAPDLIPAILALSPVLFLTMSIADKKGGINTSHLRTCAEVIKRVADVDNNGFGNLRFAALANCQPFTPFFPTAYGETGASAFALAMECADNALTAFTKAETIQAGCTQLQSEFEGMAMSIETVIDSTHSSTPFSFKGFDFSLAPYPEDWCSFGKALESMGVPTIGSAGSVAAAAILAAALDEGKWRKAGFNGLMMPILEDNVLASRSAAGVLSVYDVLQYSSVCGTGLDTVPLPGDITPEQISALLLDIAALSLRLDKSLTARLMPIPGKSAGDDIDFDFSFFAKGKVLDFPFSGMRAPLGNDQIIQIKSRTPR